MNQQLNSQSPQQFMNFNDLIAFLKNKLTTELTTQKSKKNSKERSIKLKNNIYKFLGQTSNISIFITMGIVLGLFLIGGGAVFQSYKIFHTLKIVSDVRKLTSIILFFSGLASAALGIVSIYNLGSIYNSICSIYDAIASGKEFEFKKLIEELKSFTLLSSFFEKRPSHIFIVYIS